VTRVALYARVSTDDRGQDPETQLLELREWARRHATSWEEYVDRASAADLRGRAAWRGVLAAARRGKVDQVAVWKLDRAFRSAAEAWATLRQLEGWQVGFTAITQDLDTTTPAGRLLFSILAAVSEMERDLIADRVRAGMARARAEGRRVGRPPAQPVKAHRRFAWVAAEVRGGRLTQAEGAAILGVRRARFAAALDGKRGPAQINP
jgi:DNA invertase Pin-like site-specific DNA recombinase